MSTEPALPPETAYRVDHDGDDIVVRMRADLLSREDRTFLDRMLMERLRRRASLTNDQIADPPLHTTT